MLSYYLLVGVINADGDLASECAPDLFFLQCVALTAFVCMAMRDFLEVLEMHQWLQMFKRSASHERLMLQRYQDQSGFTLHRPTTGLTSCTRIAFYALLLLPCLAVTTLVLIAGSGAVLRSENRFDLRAQLRGGHLCARPDDICYALFTSRSVKSETEGLPPLNMGYDEVGECKGDCRLCATYLFFWLAFGAALIIDVPLYTAWCALPVSPDVANATTNASALNGTVW